MIPLSPPLPLALARPAWLVARIRYQCNLIELCAREVEARGLLTSDVPERAVAALRRWCDGGDAPGDRASWALKPVEHPSVAMYLLLCMVREAVRTRADGERAVRDGRASFAAIQTPIGCRGTGGSSAALGILREVGMHTIQALNLIGPSADVLRDDPEQGREHDRTRLGVAIDELRESTPQGWNPTGERIREACAKYGVSAEFTKNLVDVYEVSTATGIPVRP